jgi:AI-2 transport protein TqsA
MKGATSDNSNSPAHHINETRIQTICLLILTTLALALALMWLETVIVPFVLAAFLSMVLTPVVDYQNLRLRLPRPAALLITLFIVFFVIVVVSGIVASSLGDFVSRANEIESRMWSLLENEDILKLLASLDLNISSKEDIGSLLPKGGVKRLLAWLAYSVTSVLSQSFLVMLFTVFIMVGHRPRYEARQGTMGQIEQGVRSYVNAKVAMSAFTGFTIFMILYFLGVPFAPTFGAFAFLLNFIPNIGSIIATLLPLPIILFSPGFTTTTIVLAIVLPTIVQLSVGNIIEPKIMGQSLDLHPITILAALIFWGILWGFLGMILAVPITAVIKISLQNLDFTRPIAEALAGRFESFSNSGNRFQAKS